MNYLSPFIPIFGVVGTAWCSPQWAKNEKNIVTNNVGMITNLIKFLKLFLHPANPLSAAAIFKIIAKKALIFALIFRILAHFGFFTIAPFIESKSSRGAINFLMPLICNIIMQHWPPILAGIEFLFEK